MEKLIFVREFLNEADRAKIEGYLTHKWSLADQLPSDHPYAGIDFTIDENGSLRTAREFDYETDDHNYSVRIWATDEHNATTYNDFTVVLNNVVEDSGWGRHGGPLRSGHRWGRFKQCG